MNDDIFRAADGLKGLADQVLARLDEHLDGDVVRNMAAFNQFAADGVFRFGRRREAHLDLLKADVAQGFEKLQLFLHIHRIDQRLIAVAQVNAAPNRCLVNDAGRPLPVGQRNLLERTILLK